MRKSMLMLLSAFVAVCAFGKEIRTLVVTTEPQMHCAACEKRIKDNMGLVAKNGPKVLEWCKEYSLE